MPTPLISDTSACDIRWLMTWQLALKRSSKNIIFGSIHSSAHSCAIVARLRTSASATRQYKADKTAGVWPRATIIWPEKLTFSRAAWLHCVCVRACVPARVSACEVLNAALPVMRDCGELLESTEALRRTPRQKPVYSVTCRARLSQLSLPFRLRHFLCIVAWKACILKVSSFQRVAAINFRLQTCNYIIVEGHG